MEIYRSAQPAVETDRLLPSPLPSSDRHSYYQKDDSRYWRMRTAVVGVSLLTLVCLAYSIMGMSSTNFHHITLLRKAVTTTNDDHIQQINKKSYPKGNFEVISPEATEATAAATTEAVTTEAVTTEAVTAEAVTTRNITTETVTKETVPKETITTEKDTEATAAATTEAVTTEAVTTEAVTTEAVTTEAVTAEAVTTRNITTETVTTETVPKDTIIKEKNTEATSAATTEAVTTEAVTAEAVTTRNATTETVTTETVPTETVTTETVTTGATFTDANTPEATVTAAATTPAATIEAITIAEHTTTNTTTEVATTKAAATEATTAMATATAEVTTTEATTTAEATTTGAATTEAEVQCISQVLIMPHCGLGNRRCNNKGRERSEYIATLFVATEYDRERVPDDTSMTVEGMPPVPLVALSSTKVRSAAVGMEPQFPPPAKLYALSPKRPKHARKHKHKHHKHKYKHEMEMKHRQHVRDIETLTPLANEFQLEVDASFGVKEDDDLALEYFVHLSKSVQDYVDMTASTSSAIERAVTGVRASLCDGGTTVVEWKDRYMPHLAEAFGCGKRQGCHKKWKGGDVDSMWLLTFHYSVIIGGVHDAEVESSTLDFESLLALLSMSRHKKRAAKHKAHATRSGTWNVTGELVHAGFARPLR